MLFQLGVSYGSAIQKPEHMAELFQWEVHVVELPLSSMSLQLKQIAARFGIRAALHFPSKEMVARMPFILDVRNGDQIRCCLEAAELILRKDQNWEYLVAHYPIITKHTDPDTVQRLNMEYLFGLRRIAERYDVSVFLENVAVHPQICFPEAYEAAVQMCDGFCLDVGHAHTMDAILFKKECMRSYAEDFFRLLAPYIRCIHLYNAANRLTGDYSCRKHYPYFDYGIDLGFMDTAWLEQQILQLPNLQYVIHEPHRDELLMHQKLDFGSFGSFFGGTSTNVR